MESPSAMHHTLTLIYNAHARREEIYQAFTDNPAEIGFEPPFYLGDQIPSSHGRFNG
jgi:hypothetical protein